jgi:hypothetical protein
LLDFAPETRRATGPPGASLSGLFALGGTEAASLWAAAVALDCFEVFAIYVCFRSAKPYPKVAALASGKPLRIERIMGMRLPLQIGDRDFFREVMHASVQLTHHTGNAAGDGPRTWKQQPGRVIKRFAVAVVC